jgi:hypothetical protein
MRMVARVEVKLSCDMQNMLTGRCARQLASCCREAAGRGSRLKLSDNRDWSGW